MLGSFPSPREARRDARQLATELFKDYATLNEIVERHGETIRRQSYLPLDILFFFS
jgi:hypothetical protein